MTVVCVRHTQHLPWKGSLHANRVEFLAKLGRGRGVCGRDRDGHG